MPVKESAPTPAIPVKDNFSKFNRRLKKTVKDKPKEEKAFKTRYYT